MRTSSVKPWVKAVATVVAVLVAACCVNALLSYVLEPAGSRSVVMWDDFRHTEDIDTVVVGDSLAEQSANPAVLDPLLGTSTFDMASPIQTLQSSYLGIEEGIQEHSIKRAVLGMELYQVYADFEPFSSAYEIEKGKGESPLEQLHNWSVAARGTDWWNNPQWIAKTLFPWASNRVPWGDVPLNIRLKQEQVAPYTAGQMLEVGWLYGGRGYGNFGGIFGDQVNSSQYLFSTSEPIAGAELREDRLQLVDDIIDLCDQNGVELVVYAPPVPSYHVVDAGPDYGRLSAELGDYLAQRGVAYYDFNLAKDSLFHNAREQFADHEHLNENGSRAFCEAFAKVLLAQEDGEPTEVFFESYDEHLAGMDSILMASFEDSYATQDDLTLSLKVTAPPQVAYECRFLAKGPDDADYTVVRDYAESNECTFVPAGHGVYEVMAELRIVGQEEPSRTASGTAVF